MTIPASTIVQVNPGVISTGGNPLSLNGLVLTQNLLMPTDSILSFTSQAAVAKFFGPASTEAAYALTYFNGYQNSTVKPNAILFAPYNVAAVAAWLQSGSLAGLTLAQLQAIAAGTLTITINGTPVTSSSIALSGASSFSDAATIIEAAFSGTVPVVTWNAVLSCFIFTSPTTGPYTSTITVATTDALATALALTAATGATLSQGAALDTPTSAISNAVGINQNWATFTTLVEPTLTNKELFAVWSNGQNNRYLYVAGDTDAQAIVQGSTTCFGYVAIQAAYNGVCAISGDASAATAQGTTLAALVLNLQAFVQGAIASINFSQRNGRVALAFLSQSGLGYTVGNELNSQQIAANLIANGYSYYGAYATANQGFTFFYNGNMPGEWEYVDPFVNQIFLNSQFQLTLLSLLTQIGSIPYNPAGYGLIRAAMLGPINAALNFGSIRTGVALSPAQIAEVNAAAGVNAAAVIQIQGYYLQILDPGATARGLRQSPIINFWYTDGGAVQQITLASIDIL